MKTSILLGVVILLSSGAFLLLGTSGGRSDGADKVVRPGQGESPQSADSTPATLQGAPQALGTKESPDSAPPVPPEREVPERPLIAEKAESVYLAARKAYEDGRTEECLRLLRMGVQDLPPGKKRDEFRLMLAHALLYRGTAPEAIEEWSALLSDAALAAGRDTQYNTGLPLYRYGLFDIEFRTFRGRQWHMLQPNMRKFWSWYSNLVERLEGPLDPAYHYDRRLRDLTRVFEERVLRAVGPNATAADSDDAEGERAEATSGFIRLNTKLSTEGHVSANDELRQEILEYCRAHQHSQDERVQAYVEFLGRVLKATD